MCRSISINVPSRPLFLILLILKIHHCLPIIEDLINPAGLASLEWGPHLQGLETLQFPENVSYSHFREKRFINLGSVEQTPNKPYQACMAPGDKMGHCRHLSRCVLEDFRSNFARYLDYMCIIERTYIGTCCPDRAKIIQMNSLSAESLAGVLPAVASNNDDKPIWGPAENSQEDDGVTPILENSQNASTTVSKDDPIQNITRAPRGPRGCGISTKSRTRIVGGRPADPREWPWMVALLRQKAVHYCGGVLVTDRHVLTAAHCVYQYKTHEIRVRLGEYDFTRSDETRSIDFGVVEIRQHLDFDPTTYVHDIAIVKIHRPTIFNSYIWPICLPPIGQSFENKSAIVTGWGTQYFGGPASNVLMEVAVPVWSQTKCVRSFTQRIPDTALCAGAYEGGRDSCQGDSGGPLLHQLGNGRWVNIGIVSWGIRCGEPGHPGIYTRVNAYLDWIFANAVF